MVILNQNSSTSSEPWISGTGTYTYPTCFVSKCKDCNLKDRCAAAFKDCYNPAYVKTWEGTK